MGLALATVVGLAGVEVGAGVLLVATLVAGAGFAAGVLALATVVAAVFCSRLRRASSRAASAMEICPVTGVGAGEAFATAGGSGMVATTATLSRSMATMGA